MKSSSPIENFFFFHHVSDYAEAPSGESGNQETHFTFFSSAVQYSGATHILLHKNSIHTHLLYPLTNGMYLILPWNGASEEGLCFLNLTAFW